MSRRSTTPRSTTSVGTEPRSVLARPRRRRAALLAALVVELASAAVLLVHLHRSDVSGVRLINLDGAPAAALLRRVDADLDRAVGAVEDFWGTDWPQEIVVVATASDAQFAAEAHLNPARQWKDIAAVAVADGVDFDHHRAVGQRIVLAPGASDMTDSALRIVLVHELFHFATRADTALDAPRWLTEGVADYVARPATPIPSGPAARNTALPTDADLDVSGPQRVTGYDRAWWFARFVADDYGVDGLRRLYESACGPDHGDLATAVRQALGVEMSGLQSQWARWLTR